MSASSACLYERHDILLHARPTMGRAFEESDLSPAQYLQQLRDAGVALRFVHKRGKRMALR